MNSILYIATSIGLYIVAQINGSWNIIRHSLQDHSLTSVAASNEYLIVGTPDGLWRSSDDGSTWHKVGGEAHSIHIRWLMSSEAQPQTVFAGTEPAGILISRDGGLNWVSSADVEKMRDAMGWFLPYSPEAGCVRGFAITESKNRNGLDQIYAAVEVGGVLVSSNGGKNWQLVQGSDGAPDLSRDLGTLIHPDVHSLSVHPKTSEILTASTGGGLYRSADGGKTWEKIDDGYIRAAWVDPDDPLHIVSGPADGVSRNGRIERTIDGGKTWHPYSEGMKSPWGRHMVDRFFNKDGNLFAILSNGEIWFKPSNQVRWSHILADTGHVKAMAAQ
jgi:photosystem II stability/assembly factor-like uncharacterized protein